MNGLWSADGGWKGGWPEQSALLHQLHADLTTGLRQVNADLTAGLQQVNGRIDQVNSRMDEANARIDRLMLAMLAIGGGQFAALIGVIVALVVRGS